MPKAWKQVNTKYIIKNRWISLRQDECQLPTKKTINDYYVLEYPDWVNVVAITCEQEVVLVKQYRHGLGQVTLELPSGVVEVSDETALETAKRELLEETGYSATSLIKTSALSPNPASHTNQTHSFLALNVTLTNAQALDETEDIEVVLMPLADLKAQAMQGAFSQAMHVASIFLALEKLKERS